MDASDFLAEWGTLTDREKEIARRSFNLGRASVLDFQAEGENPDLVLIDKALARLVGKTLDELLGEGRKALAVAWRDAAILWLAKVRLYRNRDITKALNGKLNHSSISTAVARSQDALIYDRYFPRKYNALKAEIKNIENENSENCSL